MKGKLKTIQQNGHIHHTLDGKLIKNGDILEIRTRGLWTKGIYQWNGKQRSPVVLHTNIDEGRKIRVLPKVDLLRWEDELI